LHADRLAERLAAVRAAIATAAKRVQRDPSEVSIVAVSKTFPAAAVEAALAAGLTDIGENYVQEAAAKRDAVGRRGIWHLIGGLQRNKVRAAVAVFDCVHTVDSPSLASTLADEAARAGRSLPVLLQVNVAGEATKRGVPCEAVEGLAERVLARPELRLEGLMVIPPAAGDSRRWFKVLRDVRDRAKQRLGVDLPHLSMGMSNDFTIAVEEGATLLRLGRALFGERAPGTRLPGSSVRGDGT
jgi:pyridoxal phosphate enzyme (YggS family)